MIYVLKGIVFLKERQRYNFLKSNLCKHDVQKIKGFYDDTILFLFEA